MHKYNCPLKQTVENMMIKGSIRREGCISAANISKVDQAASKEMCTIKAIYILYFYLSLFCITCWKRSKITMCVHYVCACVSVQPIGYFQEVVAILGLLPFFYNQISESETRGTGHHFLWTHSRTHSSARTQTHPAILTQTSTNCNCCAKRRKSHCNPHLLTTC